MDACFFASKNIHFMSVTSSDTFQLLRDFCPAAPLHFSKIPFLSRPLVRCKSCHFIYQCIHILTPDRSASTTGNCLEKDAKVEYEEVFDDRRAVQCGNRTLHASTPRTPRARRQQVPRRRGLRGRGEGTRLLRPPRRPLRRPPGPRLRPPGLR